MKKKIIIPSGNIFVHFILCQRERKRHWVVHRVQLCVLRFCAVDHFILGGRRSWVSKHHSVCVRGEICFKKIVSNTRLYLNHSSFTHLVCEFLIIYKFLLIFIQYLFITFAYHIYLCYCLYLDLYVFKSIERLLDIYQQFTLWLSKRNTYKSKHKQ